LLLAAAAKRMREEPALKSVACGTSPIGAGANGVQLSTASYFWTRSGKDISSKQHWIDGDNKYAMQPGTRAAGDSEPWPVSGEPPGRPTGTGDRGTDGAVAFPSCRAAAPDSWGEVSNVDAGIDGRVWVSANNHNDLTCRNGNFRDACRFYALAQ